MKDKATTIRAWKVVAILVVLTMSNKASVAGNFDAMVIPSLMDDQMDPWYRVPMNSGPEIPRATRITHGQEFMLLAFFRGYAVDEYNHAHVRYDVQIYGPDGKPTDDQGFDMEVYQGEVLNPQALMLNRQYLKITFTEKYPVGNYTIILTGHDKVSKGRFNKEVTIELVPFTLGDKFSTEKEVGEWFMSYYKKPEPMRSIQAMSKIIQLDSDWLKKNLNIPVFFMHIFKRNPFLSDYIQSHLGDFSLDDRKRLMIIATLSHDEKLTQALKEKGGVEKAHDFAKHIKLPNQSTEITHASYLDMYWSEFFATGRYEPINRIVSALALQKYKGSLDKLKAAKASEKTKEMNDQAYLEAVYRSATWSLISNSLQEPLVYKYCLFMYQNEQLDEGIKKELAIILGVIQKRIQEEEDRKVALGLSTSGLNVTNR